jgi:2'-hydroxyisoflavone reductase
MKLLILGGTRFLGRHIVEAALLRGHTLTIFHRGRTNPDLFPDVEHILGDRTQDLAVLQGKRWDAVIDTYGYVPRVVRKSAEFLAPVANHYTFISSVSVLRTDQHAGTLDEDAPVGMLDDPTIEEITGETYGPLKALCEQVVQEVFPERALIVRPGLIVGPADHTDRFSYWPRRVALGGEVLAPDYDRPIQIVDVRDLAGWIVQKVEQSQTGLYNAVGPDYALTFSHLLEVCREVCSVDARFTWVSEKFLEEQKVEPWSELPLWLPPPDWVEFVARKAWLAGLTFRPLSETVRDTLAWEQAHPSQGASLKPEREKALLALWHASRGE